MTNVNPYIELIHELEALDTDNLTPTQADMVVRGAVGAIKTLLNTIATKDKRLKTKQRMLDIQAQRINVFETSVAMLERTEIRKSELN